jgi:urease accessory protein
MDGIQHQRAHGRLKLRWGAKGLVDLFQASPMRALFPGAEPGEPATIAQVNVAGGLAGGDSADFELILEDYAQATLTAAAAEKIYRSLGPESRITTSVALGAGARLEWLPQELILFDGAMLQRRQEFTLGAGAELLLAEMLVFGRAARGEVFAQGQVFDSWRLRGPDGLLWADALAMAAGDLAHPHRFHGAQAMGTVLLAAEGAGAYLPALRDIMPCTLLRPGLLLARALGDASVVRNQVAAAVPLLRSAAFGLPARLPRLWRC